MGVIAMPRTAPKKCITCSELSMTEVKELHGKNGDNCWNNKVCRSRRSWYKNRQRNVEKRWQLRHPGEKRQKSCRSVVINSSNMALNLL